jgi:hypothetical protein
VTVKSDSEDVTVPAGTFAECLLIEQVTEESDAPDAAPERQRQLNRDLLCGRRRAWYAPGVGLVRLHVEQGNGVEAVLELQRYDVRRKGSAYLPLAVGNSWSYAWAGASGAFVAEESYRVAAHARDLWYLEHCHYLYRR